MEPSKYTYIGKSSKFFTNGGCYDVAAVESLKYITKDDKNEDHELSDGWLSDNFVLFISKPAYTFTSGQDVFIAQINTLAGVESQRYYIKESWCACGHQVEYADLGLLFHTKEEAESKCRELIGLPPLEPPVELVDGECYQFDYDGSSAVGFAFEGATFVSRKDGECQGVSMSDCTNIQPLTVEK